MVVTEERRQTERLPIQLQVEYRSLNTFLSDYTRNISKGGTFIQTEKPKPAGTEFVFSLLVPGFAEPLVLSGKVVWCVCQDDASPANPAGMGIEFQYKDDDERDRVAAAIRETMVCQLGIRLTEKLLDGA